MLSLRGLCIVFSRDSPCIHRQRGCGTEGNLIQQNDVHVCLWGDLHKIREGVILGQWHYDSTWSHWMYIQFVMDIKKGYNLYHICNYWMYFRAILRVIPRELHPGVGHFMLKLYVSWQRRRLGRWERSLSRSPVAWSLAWLSSWEALGLDISSSDSEEGAFPVGVSGGDSSWSAARFMSGVSKSDKNGTTK